MQERFTTDWWSGAIDDAAADVVQLVPATGDRVVPITAVVRGDPVRPRIDTALVISCGEVTRQRGRPALDWGPPLQLASVNCLQLPASA